MIVFQNRNLIVPTGKEQWSGLLCWVVYLFLPFLLVGIPLFQENSLRSDFLFELTVTIVCYIVIMVAFRSFLFRSRIPFLSLLFTCFIGFVAAHALSSLWDILLSSIRALFQEEHTNMNQELVNEFLYNYKGFMILSVAFFTPVVEEVLFRGIIFAPICRRSPFAAYVISMFIFSAFHVIGFIGVQSWPMLLLSCLEYLPAAFVLCWTYQRTHSIWAPIALHGFLNLYSSILILS